MAGFQVRPIPQFLKAGSLILSKSFFGNIRTNILEIGLRFITFMGDRFPYLTLVDKYILQNILSMFLTRGTV